VRGYNPHAQPQDEGPPLVGCLRLLILYILSYPPCLVFQPVASRCADRINLELHDWEGNYWVEIQGGICLLPCVNDVPSNTTGGGECVR